MTHLQKQEHTEEQRPRSRQLHPRTQRPLAQLLASCHSPPGREAADLGSGKKQTWHARFSVLTVLAASCSFLSSSPGEALPLPTNLHPTVRTISITRGNTLNPSLFVQNLGKGEGALIYQSHSETQTVVKIEPQKPKSKILPTNSFLSSKYF